MTFTLADRIVKVEYVGLNNCAAAGLTQWRLVFALSSRRLAEARPRDEPPNPETRAPTT